MDAKKPDSPTAEERLAKLEGHCSALARQNRTLRVVGALVLVVVAAIVMDRWTPLTLPRWKRVIAEEFTLTDGNGRPYADLYIPKPGPIGATFSLLGDDHRPRAKLVAHCTTGGFLSLNDGEGRLRVWLGVIGDKPWLGMYDEHGDLIWQAPPRDDAPEEAEADGE